VDAAPDEISMEIAAGDPTTELSPISAGQCEDDFDMNAPWTALQYEPHGFGSALYH